MSAKENAHVVKREHHRDLGKAEAAQRAHLVEDDVDLGKVDEADAELRADLYRERPAIDHLRRQP